MKRMLGIPMVFVGLGICLCTVKQPLERALSEHPVLSDLQAPTILYLDDPTLPPVRVRVSDPQGLETIERVWMTVVDTSGHPLFESDFSDDGTGGDIIPKDGLYVCRLDPVRFEGRIGSFRLLMMARDRDGHAADTLFADLSVSSGIPNKPPQIYRIRHPLALTEETLTEVCFEAWVVDSQGVSDVDSVWCDAYLPLSPMPFRRFVLNDRGLEGDSTAGDGRYALRFDGTAFFRSSGRYLLRFQARDRGGLFGFPQVGALRVIRENRPPRLSDLQAPDRVSRNDDAPILIAVRATDPQGLGDIRRVYFNSYRPDGTPAQGNPFLLYDDGSHGDPIPGDGIYSLWIHITPQNALGRYRFEFYAEDLGGLVSDPLLHEIEVIE